MQQTPELGIRRPTRGREATAVGTATADRSVIGWAGAWSGDTA
jgi:hypothetical protein